MKLTKKQITWSFILFFIIAAGITLYYIGKANGWFNLFESRYKFREYVMSFGALAPLAFFFLQFFQVVLAPIPGNVTTIAGGMLFGFLNAFLISTAAVFPVLTKRPFQRADLKMLACLASEQFGMA